MATEISKDVLNRETNARFWGNYGYKIDQKLDPANPTDKAMMPLWMDIFRKVSAEAKAGTLVTTYDHPEIAQKLADAAVASTVAAMHVDAGAKAPDPATAQQHVAAAATASHVAQQKLSEAAAKQPPTVSPTLAQEAAKEAAKTPPSPRAPAADQLAHAQTQALSQNGKILRPEDDPWGAHYVAPPKSPREQAQAQPSKSPRERSSIPAREVLQQETNHRFWQRYNYKRGQKLDMTNPQDVEMSKIWRTLLQEVEREANEGRLTFTPPPPSPSKQQLPPPGAQPWWPPSVPPYPASASPGAQSWWPPSPPPMPYPGVPRPGVQRPLPPGMQRPMPPYPGMQQQQQAAQQQAAQQQAAQQQAAQQQAAQQQAAQQQAAQQQAAQQQAAQQQAAQQQAAQQQAAQQQAAQQQAAQQQAAQQQAAQQQAAQQQAAPPSLKEESFAATTEAVPAEEGMSVGTIGWIALGLATAAGVTYAVTRTARGGRRKGAYA